MVNFERICKGFSRITCDSVDLGGQLGKDLQTLQGLPVTVLILGGSINGQLGKDLQRLCKDYL